MKTCCAAILAAAGFAVYQQNAQAVIGTVGQIVVQSATDSELGEIVGPRLALVARDSDLKDLRILDGHTPGGKSLWNFAAITNPPSSFPHDISMGNHHVRLDGSYSLNAEAGRMTAWYGTNVLWRIVASADESAQAILGAAPEGTNMAFTVASESEDVTVEVCSDLTAPVWTSVEYVCVRLTPQTIKITVPSAPDGTIQYVRISTADVGEVGMFLSVPLSVPSLKVGEVDLTAQLISNVNAIADYEITTELIAAWNAAASYGNHADAGYITDESDPSFSAWLGGSPLDDYVPISVVNSNYYVDMCPNGSMHTIIKVGTGYEMYFEEDEVSYNGTLLWRNENGVNRLFGPITVPSGTTNYFVRPDGGTNTVCFDTNFNMIVAVDGVVSLCVATNGNVGIKRLSEVSYALTISGAIKSSASITGSTFYDTSGGGSVDPSGISTMGGIVLTNVPTTTNGLASGRIWNDGGTLKLMP